MLDKLLKNWGAIVALGSYIVGLVIWISTMNGIPTRVADLEESVKQMSIQVTKNDTKIDVILEDTKFIKQLVVQKYTK